MNRQYTPRPPDRQQWGAQLRAAADAGQVLLERTPERRVEVDGLHHAGRVERAHGRLVQPEYLQHRCTPERLARALDRLLSNGEARADQIAGYREVTGQLKSGEIPPSRLAAQKILALAGHKAVAKASG